MSRDARPGPDDHSRPVDPVRRRREQYRLWTGRAQRVGYLLYLTFLVLSVIGLATGLPAPVVTGMLVSLIGGSVLLAPAIVLGYAVKAADRDDRERGL